MGSLGLPATAMAVRSAFALLCFALLCGLAASSVGQFETETELTKREGEAAGNNLLVEQALESREVRGARAGGRCRNMNGKRKEKCLLKLKKRHNRKGRKEGKKKCPKGQKLNNKKKCKNGQKKCPRRKNDRSDKKPKKSDKNGQEK